MQTQNKHKRLPAPEGNKLEVKLCCPLSPVAVGRLSPIIFLYLLNMRNLSNIYQALYFLYVTFI